MIEAPLSWIKEIHATLIDAGTVPLSGYLPEFPWKELSLHVASLLQIPELEIFPRQTKFLQGPNIESGLGVGYISIALDLAPLNGGAYWLMGKEDVTQLTALALTSVKDSKGFSSPKFQEGFYYYLGTQIVQVINELRAFDDLALRIARPAAVTAEESLCIDVSIQLPKQTLWGRLVCPALFHEAVKTHFNTQPPPALTSALAKQIDVTIGVELGQTHLSIAEWKKVGVGDFILLDRCTFDPKMQRGTATITLEQTPILRVRIKDNCLKIVDYAFYREEQHQMKPEIPKDDEKIHEDFESEELSQADSDELSHTEVEEESLSDTSHLWSPEDGELDKLISSKEIPLTLTVEVARLRINLEKLLQLSVGNVLELPVKPQQGVNILIGGKKVAKAELVNLGEMLGVKILQLGD